MADTAAPTQSTTTSTQSSQGTSATPGKTESAPLTQAGAKPVKTPESQQQPPKTYELKVNGKVRKYTEDEMVARARLADAADERFNEGAKMRKEAETAIGRLRDPSQVMDALLDPSLGLNKEQVRQAFEAWYEREYIEPEKLTEDQKKLREAEAKIKKYAEQEKQQKAAREQAEQDELTAKARGEIQKQILEALDTNSLPKTNFTVRRLAYWIQRNQANGFNAPTSLLVSQVKNEFNSSIRDMVEASDGEALIQLLGDGLVQKIRKYDLDQLRKLRGGGQSPEQPAPANTEPNRERPPSSADVTAKLRELQRTGRY